VSRHTGVAAPAGLAAAVLPLVLTGCGAFVAPTQQAAGELTDVVNNLVRRNMTVTGQVAGDPGCGGGPSSLYSNAVRYDIRPPGSTQSYPVYVFDWKSQQAFDADKAAFDACVGSAKAQSTAGLDAVEHLPWRAFGPGWTPELRDAVDAALTEAGGVPAPQAPQ